MNLRNLTYSLLATALLWSGCSDDPFNKYGITDNTVKMKIQLHVPALSPITTRSSSTGLSDTEATISNPVVLIFNKQKVLVQKPIEAGLSTSSTTEASITAQLLPTGECSLYVVANLTDELHGKLVATEAGATYASVQNLLTANLDKEAENIALPAPFPMSGAIELAGISEANKNVTIPLTLAVARFDVDGAATDPGKEGFTVTGMYLVNAAPSGYILPTAEPPYWEDTDVVPYAEAKNTASDTGVYPTQMAGKVYCYEKKGLKGDTPSATRIVVSGCRAGITTPTYYPIDIIYEKTTDGTARKTYDIERNKLYTIKLGKVEKEGYRTYAEAAKSEAFNSMVDAEIVVTDPYSYDITTNGKQYMGVTNAEFVIYPAEGGTALNNLHITTLAYTSDPNWSSGTIICSSGISLVDGSLSRLDVRGDGIATYRDIVANIAKGTTSGTITLQIGNLMKVIKVRVGDATPTAGIVLNNYFDSTPAADKTIQQLADFKVGEIISPDDNTSWLKVASTPTEEGTSTLNDKIVNPDGGIYLHVQPNIGFNISTNIREASAYIAGENDDQRIKILVQQSGFDIYYKKENIEPFTYVGVFHRWNQTGERIIRIDGSQVKDPNNPDTEARSISWWRATVVAGRDFIVLDTKKSEDPRLHVYKNNDDSTPNPYGVDDDPNFETTDDYVERYQVDSKLRTVEGTGSYVYFRVGLTGKLSSATAQPRYGLITVEYGMAPGVTTGRHKIFVRQGEAPDYLMRPWDPSTTSAEEGRTNEFPSGTRPKAAKFGVYNLTDPYVIEPGNTKPNTPIVDRGTRGYTFTQYPSQGGFFFPFSQTTAVDPRATASGVTLSQGNVAEWKSAWETCPKGYRRPNDGKVRNMGTDPDDIKYSEVRQSLWLFPLHGKERSDYSNQLTGYIADGYFDRHPIVNTTDPGVTVEKVKKNAIVRSGTANVAYRGYLLFNPYNYASIFLPFAGMYFQMSSMKWINYRGGEGYFNTSTPSSSINWIVAFGYISASGTPKYVFDNYSAAGSQCSAYSIRCIKDELPPAITDGTGLVPVEDETTQPMVGNLSYDDRAFKSLQAKVEDQYNDPTDRVRINTLALNVVHTLSTADYIFLNNWVSGKLYTGSLLKHIILRGVDNSVLPSGAFTNPNWQSIVLVDIKEIQAGAFGNNLTKLTNLSSAYLDDMTVAVDAFGFDTSKVNLHLSGAEYKKANLTDKSWQGKTWKSIKEY